MRIGTQGKEQWCQRRLNQTYLLVLEGLLQRRQRLWLTVSTRTLAEEVLGSTPWCEPSQSLPLASPKSPGRLQCWVASGKTTNREGTQPHPSTVKWIKVLLNSAHQSNSQLYPPPVPSLLDSLIHHRADSRSKNYNPAACGTKTTFTERYTRRKGRGLWTR